MWYNMIGEVKRLSMKDDVACLRHILECIRRIEENVARGRERFLASHTLPDAVLRNPQTVAESIQRLSDAQKTIYPEIEWRRIGRSRDALIDSEIRP